MNNARIGRFTSSRIADLMTNGKSKGSLGKPAMTYIEEKSMERRLGRRLDIERSARETSWGKLVESRVFELLGLEYELVSQDTIVHPEIPSWAGSPDAIKFVAEKSVVDIKSPLTLKSFCQLVDPLYEGLDGIEAMRAVREKHDKGEIYYWQLVSNAVLTNTEWAELIIYVPYLSELQTIRDMASGSEDAKQHNYFWINQAEDDELPYLIEGGFYKNLNIIRFEVPEDDKLALRNRVVEARLFLDKFAK